ncbi:uncharacterized protein LOC116612208 [Nematostella vectensis]|uniref:uncharacterized protein LOC116612208 n=1 Tax=Nematostella vectensis TaxID=45351 RepID=UPI0020778980|nr:uncharacterized protein LOC116612208 [Nematostella vectensis]
MTSKKFVVVEWTNNAEDRCELTVLRGKVLRQGGLVSVVFIALQQITHQDFTRQKCCKTSFFYLDFRLTAQGKQFENELLEGGNDSVDRGLQRCSCRGSAQSSGAMRGNYGMTDEKMHQLIRNQQKSLKDETKKVFSKAK